MHEFAAAKGIMGIVKSECERGGISSPERVYLELGQLTPYAKECVVFYFDALKEDEGMPKARLQVKVVKGMVQCGSCGKRSPLKGSPLLSCQRCGSRDVRIVQGKDFKITKITGE